MSAKAFCIFASMDGKKSSAKFIRLTSSARPRLGNSGRNTRITRIFTSLAARTQQCPRKPEDLTGRFVTERCRDSNGHKRAGGYKNWEGKFSPVLRAIGRL